MNEKINLILKKENSTENCYKIVSNSSSSSSSAAAAVATAPATKTATTNNIVDNDNEDRTCEFCRIKGNKELLRGRFCSKICVGKFAQR